MIIKAKNLAKKYLQSHSGAEREVLTNLDLEVLSGERIALMGPSGSGKTTLLNLLGTLDKPDKGQISIDNKLLSELSDNEILNFRNKKAGFVFQFHNLLPQCTIIENVLLPVLPNKGDKSEIYKKAEDLLEYMGIWELRNNKPNELSGGECQRAAVARALINSPELILADEPTGSLDAKNAEALIDLLIDINKKMNVSLIIATHSKSIAKRMDKVYTIVEGKLADWKE